MKLLLTSSGITNNSIKDALTGLLGKPISACHALFIPTAIYPFKYGARYAWNPVAGNARNQLCDLGWKTMGILELTALPGIEREVWLPAVREADALLFWGGDPVYLSYWLKQSGLAELLPSLLAGTVYVGVSAGSMAASTIFAETYSNPPGGKVKPLSSADIIFQTPEGEITRSLVTANGAGLVDFALIPHLDNKDHGDASMANAEKWASQLPVPVYAIDDQSAVKVSGSNVEVVSEGSWKLFSPRLND